MCVCVRAREMGWSSAAATPKCVCKRGERQRLFLYARARSMDFLLLPHQGVTERETVRGRGRGVCVFVFARKIDGSSAAATPRCACVCVRERERQRERERERSVYVCVCV